jgi:hypothetical protein
MSRLIELYQLLYEHTKDECLKCRCPRNCCAPEFCEFAIENAKEQWGIELKPTDHPTLPLMGPTGCIAPPHTRPVCTRHTCEINAFGFKRGDPEWTERYFEIRDEIEELEGAAYYEQQLLKDLS